MEAHLQPHFPLTLPPSGSRRASSRSGVGPAGVERYVRDGFDEFLFGGAVVHRAAVVLPLVIRLVTVTRLLAAVARGRPPASRRRAGRQRELLRVGSLTIARAPVDDRPRPVAARAGRQTGTGWHDGRARYRDSPNSGVYAEQIRPFSGSRHHRFGDTSRADPGRGWGTRLGGRRTSSRALGSVAALPARGGAASMNH